MAPLFVRRFARNNAGNITILFALCSLIVLGAAGLGIDSLYRANVRSHVQESLDAAVLAGAKKDTGKIATAQRIFDAAINDPSSPISSTRVNVSFNATDNGGVSGTVVADPAVWLLGAAGILPDQITIESGAEWGNYSSDVLGCVYLTDHVNTGLDMEDSSNFEADCAIQIWTTNTAIEIDDSATARFELICARGTLDVDGGTLLPTTIDGECVPVEDPFEMLAPPAEITGLCNSNADVTVTNGQTVPLSSGVHCGLVTIESGGELALAAGIHQFRGGLNVDTGGLLSGVDVLAAFDRSIPTYRIDGDVNISGLVSGPYQGFVLYHDDYLGGSNEILIGPNANFVAEGVIYLPNTNFKMQSNVNEFATHSILITDRFELEGNASFRAVVQTNGPVPLPHDSLAVGFTGLRLTK